MNTATLRLALLATAAVPVSPAFAQDAGESDDYTIVVTAQKVEQRAQDVPITISAVSGKRIKELGISDLDELSNYVPGLNIQEQSANNPGVVIRGITSDSGSAQQGPRVTLYYNGVDISRSRGSYQAIYDLDRVEVIKGPQATLFGTASAVGAISLISARPREGFSAELTGGYGNFDSTLLSGFINAGSDTLAGRIAFEWKKRDGYVENLATTQSDELYSQDNLGIRASLRFTPNDDLTVDLIGTFDRQRNGGTPFISGSFPTAAGPANPFGVANLSGSPFSEQVLGSAELGLNREVYDLNLTLEYTLSDTVTLTTVNGYREFDSLEVFDADGSAAWYLEFAEQADGWQASHETRFTYTTPAIRASAGWNLFFENGRQNVPFSSEEGTFLQCLGALGIPQTTLPCVAANGTVPASQATALATGGLFTQLPYQSEFENQGKNDSYSFFADATVFATDALELTAGLRFLIEDRQSGYTTVVPNPVLPNLVPGRPLVRSLIPGQIDTGGQTFRASESYDAFLPRFNALYRITPELNVFATVSKGRRSPVVQLDATRDPVGNPIPRVQLIPQEVVWNYEGGIKFANPTVQASVGVYYQQYDGFQVTTVTGTGQTRTESAGKASNLGVEAEVSIRPANWLTVFGNAGYIDGGIDENATFAPQFSGARFRLQPEWQLAGGFTIDAPLGGGLRLFATPSITHRSRIFFEVPNNPLISQEAVTLVNARAGISFADDRFELAAFVRNATNEDYLLDAGNTGGAFGRPTFIPAEPRMYGVQLTARLD